MSTEEEIEVAVRAWVPTKQRKRRKRHWVDPGPSPWTLIFDTETTTDLGQSLRFGAYHVRRYDALVEQGLFFDPDGLEPEEITTLVEFGRSRAVATMTRAAFVRDVFFKVVWERRGTLIGYNLAFDISRIAVGHVLSRPKNPSMRGAFSFELDHDHYKPRVQIKKINSRASMMRLASPSGRHAEQRNRERGGNAANHSGYFIDVATLASALLSFKGGLGGLTEQLGTTSKLKGGEHGASLTAQYLRYALGDVQATWECFVRLRTRYELLGLSKTPLHRILSEASVGKAYLREMGIEPK
jgi:hypothetical protein